MTVKPSTNEMARRSHYLLSAAIDIMESTFGNSQVHEEVIGARTPTTVHPSKSI